MFLNGSSSRPIPTTTIRPTGDSKRALKAKEPGFVADGRNLSKQPEQDAAIQAMGHADTPTTAYFDALGRPFLTVARNRVVCAGHDLHGIDDSFATRVELDIEPSDPPGSMAHTDAMEAKIARFDRKYGIPPDNAFWRLESSAFLG